MMDVYCDVCIVVVVVVVVVVEKIYTENVQFIAK
jgi:hypothetical protein